jgi:hypothetical protein
MIRIKQGVDLSRLTGRMALAAVVVRDVYEDHRCNAVVTRGCEPPDSEEEALAHPDSKHYLGDALDFRVLGIPMETREKIAAEVREALGAQFDVVLKADHLHVEFDPDG